jgi:hypothetical protein
VAIVFIFILLIPLAGWRWNHKPVPIWKRFSRARRHRELMLLLGSFSPQQGTWGGITIVVVVALLILAARYLTGEVTCPWATPRSPRRANEDDSRRASRR